VTVTAPLYSYTVGELPLVLRDLFLTFVVPMGNNVQPRARNVRGSANKETQYFRPTAKDSPSASEAWA
jgi:hypothetical protein